jgi:hypothetical protein
MEKEFGKIIRIDLDLYIINLEKSNNIICAKAR